MILENQSSAITTPGVASTEESKVLTTLQSDAGGKAVIQHVERHPASDSFAVHLTTKAPHGCTIAWL